MPDTGAPWNIPYVQSSDLVSDWPADSLALANAIDSGLDAAGGLVAVKHALFTGTQTGSRGAGANLSVTDLSITHTLADSSNKLIISAYLGVVASSRGNANVGIAVADGATLIGVGAAAGSRSIVAAGGWASASGTTRMTDSRSVTFVYEPGDTASHTYTVRAINIDASTQTIYVNRSQGDANDASYSRGSSGFVIQEVQV